MLALNSTYLPSGVNASGVSAAELVVSRVAVPPFALIIYISAFPERSDEKAMLLPSGLHTGSLSYDERDVSLTASPPVVATFHISPLYVNTISLPSGEIFTSRSHMGVTACATPAVSAETISVLSILFIFKLLLFPLIYTYV